MDPEIYEAVILVIIQSGGISDALRINDTHVARSAAIIYLPVYNFLPIMKLSTTSTEVGIPRERSRR